MVERKMRPLFLDPMRLDWYLALGAWRKDKPFIVPVDYVVARVGNDHISDTPVSLLLYNYTEESLRWFSSSS
ncbi:hypothetical protein N7475_001962 [Penicillium sp. IBT 31633x]|nr:hypothetical protein N7475_001962 [Penicillium sp. IBT 31633x]